MVQNRMIGVVLWSDAADCKAVIWCEDHGKLAYYTPGDTSAHTGDIVAAAGLDAGDLIRFDLSEHDHLRFAHNPEVLRGVAFPSLAQNLASARSPRAESGGEAGYDTSSRPAPANSDSVIDFSKASTARLRASA